MNIMVRYVNRVIVIVFLETKKFIIICYELTRKKRKVMLGRVTMRTHMFNMHGSPSSYYRQTDA